MHAFLFVSGSDDDINSKALEISDINIEYPIKKIADVKCLIRDTQSKYPSATSIVVKDVDEASIEAQNAFLKLLEEPQENIKFILTAKQESKVLPTILSRVKIIVGSSEARADNSSFKNLSTSQKLETISKITKREEAIEFLANLVISSDMLLSSRADECLDRVKSNSNISIQLSNFVIQLGG